MIAHEQQWEADVVLADGTLAHLRPIAPGDTQGIHEFYGRVSAKSKYLRFFSAHPTLSEEDLRNWMDTDAHDRVTLVMLSRGAIVGTARFAVLPHLLPQRVADVSFLVQDDMHGRGAGNILLEHLAQIGRECQVERFFAETLTENRSMLQVFIRAGYTVNPKLEDGFVVVDFPLDPTEKSKEVMQRRELIAEANSIRALLDPTKLAVTTADTLPENLDQLRGVMFRTPAAAPMPAEQAEALLRQARAQGVRVVGPVSLGLISTDPDQPLNTTPLPTPRASDVGLFCQSAGVAALMLSAVLRRDIGLSNFFATGSFGDVTANDVMQFWATDERTNVALLCIDAVGNPRKFFRILKRLALEKHVVVFVPSRALHASHGVQQVGSGASGDSAGSAGAAASVGSAGAALSAPTAALDQVVARSGAIVATRRETMLDIATLLTQYGVPKGRRLAILGNSAGLNAQVMHAARRFHFEVVAVETTPWDQLVAEAQAYSEQGKADVVMPVAVEIDEAFAPDLHAQWEALVRPDATPTLVPITVHSLSEPHPELFDNYAAALEALDLIITAQHHRVAARPHPEDAFGTEGDTEAVAGIIEDALTRQPEGGWLSDEDTAAVLAAYDIPLVPWQRVTQLTQAREAVERFGWGAAIIKSIHPSVRGRPELGAVRRGISDEEALAAAWRDLAALGTALGEYSMDAFDIVVQPEAPAGPAMSLRGIEDLTLGPMVSAGFSGAVADLLDDRSWRVPPLRRADARSMLDELTAAPMLHGYRGTKAARLDVLETLLMQLSRLNDEHPSIVDVELTPVIAGHSSASVVGARIKVAPPPDRGDRLARSLT